MEGRQRIICDVNIWYYIGNGSIKANDIEDLCLIASGQNIIELASSDNLIYDLEIVKQAVLAIDKYTLHIIPLESFDHIIKEYIDPDYFSPSEETIKNTYYSLLSWAKGEITFRLDTDEEKQYFKSLIDANEKITKKYVQDVNLALTKIKLETNEKFKIGQSISKQEFIDLQLDIIDVVFDIISYRTGLAKTAFTLPTDQLEFMIKSWTRLYRNILSIGNAKLQNNDPEDKGYLPYVGKDDLFWSGDKKFLNKIRVEPKDNEINKYLFDPDRNLINEKVNK